jgi:hypothetical protein
MSDQARKPYARPVLRILRVASTTPDPYAVCRRIHHYARKNGYALVRAMLEQDVPPWYVDALERNGVISIFALSSSGPRHFVGLTDKGLRMAEEPPPVRRGRT